MTASSPHPLRVGVLGTFVWDTVWTLADQAAGRPREGWGGMAFSLAAAAAALPAGWEIIPLAHVGADLIQGAHEFLDTLPGIGSRDGVVAVAQPNNRVELVYTSAAERGERMSGGVPGWSWDELAPQLTGLDALYVNFFSGWELDLACAERLRGFGIPLYADLHSLFLGPPRADGPRVMRALPDADAWLGCFHAVQLNAAEYELLCRAPLPSGRGPVRLLEHGAGAAFVTLGEEGAAWAARSPHPLRSRGGDQVVSGTSPPENSVTGDPTGAGDAWGITTFLGMLEGRPVPQAAARANRLAAERLTHPQGGSGLYAHLAARRHAWDAISAA